MLMLPPLIWVSSTSLTVMVLSTVMAVLFSLQAVAAPAGVMTGAMFNAVRMMLLVTLVLVAAPAASELASVTAQVMVRVVRVLFTVGSVLVELKVTVRSAAVYSVKVAVPVSVSTPPVLLRMVMPLCDVKPSVSPITGLVRVTVAPAICVSSASDTTKTVASITCAAWASV